MSQRLFDGHLHEVVGILDVARDHPGEAPQLRQQRTELVANVLERRWPVHALYVRGDRLLIPWMEWVTLRVYRD